MAPDFTHFNPAQYRDANSGDMRSLTWNGPQPDERDEEIKRLKRENASLRLQLQQARQRRRTH